MSEFEPDMAGLEATGYPPQAFNFVREGLEHTVKLVHGAGEPRGEDETRHVSGQQLCMGIKSYAVKQYGLLARTVLRSWNVHSTADFGKIVFAMIEAGMMRKTDDDQLEDFVGVFEFDEAFGDLPVGRA